MKKYLLMLLALFMAFALISCDGLLDIPEDDNNDDDETEEPYEPPVWVNPVTWQEALTEATGVEFPENLYFNINSALDTYEVWKLGQNILVHLYDLELSNQMQLL